MSPYQAGNPITIIIFGISGVGKSWMLSRLAEIIPYNAEFASASSLLKRALSSESEELRKSPLERVISNQVVLAKEFAKIRSATTGQALFLDAHSLIDNGDHVISIPVETVEFLTPDHLVFIRDDPKIILERRTNDTRIRPDRTIDELDLHQELALGNCRTYSSALDIPLTIIRSGDVEALMAMLDHVSQNTP